MASIGDIAKRSAQNTKTFRATEMHGLVTSYDPKNHLAKVMLQPWGYESGWLPIHTSHIGQTYGIAIGLQPGSGMGGGDQGGSSGGSSSGQSGQSQNNGDQVIVSYQEDDGDAGKITGRVHSTEDKPLQVQSGEMAVWTVFKKDSDSGPDSAQSGQQNNTGQKIFFKNDGGLYSEDGAGAAHFMDGSGNTTHNAVGKHTTQVIQKRDSSPFDSLSGSQSSGSSPQVIHHTTHDLNKGVTTGAFQDQHKTTWDQNGITHSSSSNVTSTAPNIPHNGNTQVSQNLTVTQGITAQSYATSSDVRLKTNITEFASVLDRVMAMKVKRFDKRGIATDENGKQSISPEPAEPTFGFIAQELREVFPELVNGDEAEEFLTVSESKVGIVLLAAFQEFVNEMRRELAWIKSR